MHIFNLAMCRLSTENFDSVYLHFLWVCFQL